jgi:hypothetical protein
MYDSYAAREIWTLIIFCGYSKKSYLQTNTLIGNIYFLQKNTIIVKTYVFK